MYVVMNRIPVNKPFVEDIEERFKKRLGSVDSSPGFVRNFVLRPDEDSGEHHIVMTLWEDKASFEAWTQSDSFREAHKSIRETPKEMYAGRNVLEKFEVVSDSSNHAV